MAKKKAEKDLMEQKARDAKQKARDAKKEQEAAAKAQAKADAAATSAAKHGRARDSPAALEAQAALEEERRQQKAKEQQKQQDAQRVEDQRRRMEEMQVQKAIEMSLQDQGGRGRVAERSDRRADLVVSPASPPPAPGSQDTLRSWQDAEVTCKYVGTFEVGAGKIDKRFIKDGIRSMRQHVASARPAVLYICLEGIKVIDASTNKVAMAHALMRVSMSSVDADNSLFGFVAKNPGDRRNFCHVFVLRKQRHAEEVQALMSKAFRLAFSNERTKAPAPPAGPAPVLPQSSAPSSSSSSPSSAAAAAAASAGTAGRDWAKLNPLQGLPTPKARRLVSSDEVPSSSRPTSPPPGQPPARKTSSNAASPAAAAASAAAAAAPPSEGLDHAAWFQQGIPREIAMELLAMSDDGAFIVRDSQSQPGNYALTMRGNTLMHHFIIRQTPRGLVLGLDEDRQPFFATLHDLITHYSKHKGVLPCCLDLDHDNKLCNDDAQINGDLESFVDSDYQSLKQLGLR